MPNINFYLYSIIVSILLYDIYDLKIHHCAFASSKGIVFVCVTLPSRSLINFLFHRVSFTSVFCLYIFATVRSLPHMIYLRVYSCQIYFDKTKISKYFCHVRGNCNNQSVSYSFETTDFSDYTEYFSFIHAGCYQRMSVKIRILVE